MLYRVFIIGMMFLVSSVHAAPVMLQPGPDKSQDIWTTSNYSYAPVLSYPGGGLADYRLRVGGWGDTYFSLLQFNLTDMPKQVNSARLNLYCFSNNAGSTTKMNLYRNTSQWDWKTSGTGFDRLRLWWQDQPSTTFVSSLVAAPVVGNWYSIDITQLYNDWQSGAIPNYGVELQPYDTYNNWNEFYSSRYMDDVTLRPNIVVDNIPEPAPQIILICFVMIGFLRKRH